MDTRTDLIAELFHVVGRFRRQLRRSTGSGFDATGLTQSQAEMLGDAVEITDGYRTW